MELNNLALSENPESIFLAQIFEQKALCLNKLGKLDDAEENFLLAFQAMREFPNVKPNVQFTFGIFVIENNINKLYKKVMEILDEFDEMKSGIVFPVTEYYFYGIKAIILNREGDFVTSKPLTQKAIAASEKQYSGLSRHPKVGLVDETGNLFFNELVSIFNK